MYINPMLNQSEKRIRRKRSDAKYDIKIPVTADEKEFIIRASIGRGESETKYCTQLLKSALGRTKVFDESEYRNTGLTVHIKVNREIHDDIGYYAAIWQCRSIRKATHRIFMSSLKLERGEIVFEGIQ
ncbi:hypothetical protein [Alkalihalophilus marmarensis]|uniref:Uncharacterized protein n=1 Tax=Alkalihalophilus marmarensis DSM 21297 TaxID=1188261 RepID=U6SRW8_9BACI|nr:hypothetical protein [Alkalihalophilus marmarensis]ERN54338.1 hypothetical protein A33I_07935 [Alkalihalophilus marmarensis DSM 21297]